MAGAPRWIGPTGEIGLSFFLRWEPEKLFMIVNLYVDESYNQDILSWEATLPNLDNGITSIINGVDCYKNIEFAIFTLRKWLIATETSLSGMTIRRDPFAQKRKNFRENMDCAGLGSTLQITKNTIGHISQLRALI